MNEIDKIMAMMKRRKNQEKVMKEAITNPKTNLRQVESQINFAQLIVKENLKRATAKGNVLRMAELERYLQLYAQAEDLVKQRKVIEAL